MLYHTSAIAVHTSHQRLRVLWQGPWATCKRCGVLPLIWALYKASKQQRRMETCHNHNGAQDAEAQQQITQSVSIMHRRYISSRHLKRNTLANGLPLLDHQCTT